MRTEMGMRRGLGMGMVMLLVLIGGAHARVTLGTVRELTNTTQWCRERIEEAGGVGLEGREGVEGVGWMAGNGGVEGEGQVVLVDHVGGDTVGVRGDGERDERDDIEDTISSVLRILCSDMLLELNKPLSSTPSSSSSSSSSEAEPNCPLIQKEFSLFLAQTTKFLYAIQERQMRFAWKSDSLVVRELAWMQGLWASRRGNTQDRSFIEQQMELYKGTKCFTNINKEVLRKDVEVVEYLNDLIEMFDYEKRAGRKV